MNDPLQKCFLTLQVYTSKIKRQKKTNSINTYLTFKDFARVFSFQVKPLRGNATIAVVFAEVTLKALKIKKLN